MQRMNIVGTSGSGKSTFSRALAKQLAYPYVEMDRLFWRPNWQQSSDEDFFAAITQHLAGECWVLDGNYNRSVAVKWARVDTVIWLDYSFARTSWQAIRRAVQRCLSGKEIWPGTGNVETFRNTFFNKQSVLLWTLKTWRSNRERYLQVMQSPEYGHIRFIRLRNPREAKALLASLR